MCPCGSGQSYLRCCQIYHNGKLPETALQLMPARYSAYAFGRSDFIIKTTHPKHKDFQKNHEAWQKKIEEFSNTTQFKKLEIFSFEEGEDVSFVTFRAHLEQGGKPYILEERSRFEKV